MAKGSEGDQGFRARPAAILRSERSPGGGWGVGVGYTEVTLDLHLKDENRCAKVGHNRCVQAQRWGC